MGKGISGDRTRIFETDPVPKAVMTMAVPTVITSLVTVIYSLSDTYFVGLLNDPVQTAAVTLAGPLMLLFNVINNLFGVSASSFFSRCLGKKDFDTARNASCFGIYSAACCSVLFSIIYLLLQSPILQLLGTNAETMETAKAYMRWTVLLGAPPSIMNLVLSYFVRAEGYSAHASIGTLSGCVLNILLDPLFILPQFLGLGASGAGLATLISNIVATLYFLVLLYRWRKKSLISLRPSDFRWNRDVVKEIGKVGIPASLQNLFNVIGMTLLNNFTAAFGADAVAAMGIAQKIAHVPFSIAMGVSQGIMPLVGYNYSAKNKKRTGDVITFALAISLGFMILCAVACCLFRVPLMEMFMKTDSVVAYGSRFLIGMSIAMPFLIVDFVGVGVFMACGFGKYALVFAILRKIVLEIPALFVLNRVKPLYGIPYAQVFSEVILAIAALWILRKRMDTQETVVS